MAELGVPGFGVIGVRAPVFTDGELASRKISAAPVFTVLHDGETENVGENPTSRGKRTETEHGAGDGIRKTGIGEQLLETEGST